MHPYLVNHSDIRQQRVHKLPEAFFKNASDMTFREIAYVVLDVLLGDEIEADALKRLVDTSLSDTQPFSPEAESAFVAALWAYAGAPLQAPTLLCAVEPEDFYLVDALSGRCENLNVIMPKGMMGDVVGARAIDVQGSATDCLHLCSELERFAMVCTLHNAAASAVRVAVAIYCATHPQISPDKSPEANSAAMLRAYEIARKLGLRCEPPVLVSAQPTAAPRMKSSRIGSKRSLRVAPTVDAVMRILSSSISVK